MHSSLTSVFMPVISTKHATIVFSCSKIMQSRATPNVCYNLDVPQNLLWIIHRKFWRTFIIILIFSACVCLQEADLLRLYSLYHDSNILQNVERWKDWLHAHGYYFVYVQMEELWRHVLSDQLVFMEKENWDIYQELLYVMSIIIISLFCFISRSRDQ